MTMRDDFSETKKQLRGESQGMETLINEEAFLFANSLKKRKNRMETKDYFVLVV